MSDNNDEKKEKLLQIIQHAVQTDIEMRAKFQIGEKFRFVRDRLNALLKQVEENLQTLQEESTQASNVVSEGEIQVYVHLFNAQGLVLQTWQKMLKDSVFYEHSVNRPVYGEKTHIESLVRAKTNKAQHGFLTIAVSNDAIIRLADSELLKDSHGNPLIKVKEGSLEFNKLISFTHMGIDYVVDKDGDVIKKEN